MRTPAPAALLLVLAVAACWGPAQGGPSTPAAGPLLVPLEAEPAERVEAGIEAAFDTEQAGALVMTLPDDLDFNRHALICVSLGERPTTGWGLDLQSAAVVGGELHIRARETRPRVGAQTRTTYPGGCGLLDRAALPAGELPVRADDTISEEFIVSDVLTVPAPAGAP